MDIGLLIVTEEGGSKEDLLLMTIHTMPFDKKKKSCKVTGKEKRNANVLEIYNKLCKIAVWWYAD